MHTMQAIAVAATAYSLHVLSNMRRAGSGSTCGLNQDIVKSVFAGQQLLECHHQIASDCQHM